MIKIERARPGDREPIEALIRASALPLDGLEAALPFAVLARDGDRMIGVAALEPYGHVGLMRSVAVVTEFRGQGAGHALVEATERLAEELGIDELYLLTETAEGWFARQGYERVDRLLMPEALTTSAEFRGACPETAVAMRRSPIPTAPYRAQTAPAQS
jgi:amino-acid N-acetyltransferase